MKTIALALLIVAALAGYLLAWPTPVDPAAWHAPHSPGLTGPYAVNDKLRNLQLLAVGVGRGPEGIAVDGAGRVYAGYDDGRVIELAADGASYRERADTHGRPLGVSVGADGRLVVADAENGLMEIGSKPEATVLSSIADGGPFRCTDDAALSADGQSVYFTDASDRYPLSDYLFDLLEHRPNGRLMRYDFATHQTTVLMNDLYFANGVTLGPDEDYVLVNETGAYRITRYWLKGDKAGSHDVFIDNLPGFPDNLSFNGRDRYWVALASPRDAALDALSDRPWLRKLVARLPGLLQPAPKKVSFVLGIDLNGKVVNNLQYTGQNAYAPITSVREAGPWLYFGSLSATSIARLPLQRVLADAPPPPPGWEDAPKRPTLDRSKPPAAGI